MKLTTEHLEAMFTWLSARHYAELKEQREADDDSLDSDSRHCLFLQLLSDLEKEIYFHRSSNPSEQDPSVHPVHQQREPMECPHCKLSHPAELGKPFHCCFGCGRMVRT